MTRIWVDISDGQLCNVYALHPELAGYRPATVDEMTDPVEAMSTAFGEYSFAMLHTRDATKAKDAALQALKEAGYVVMERSVVADLLADAEWANEQENSLRDCLKKHRLCFERRASELAEIRAMIQASEQ